MGHGQRPAQTKMISQKRKQPGNSTAAASQKRARFAAGIRDPATTTTSSVAPAAPGGDNDGDLDLDEQDRKRTQQGRKGRVVTEGYDSDESAQLADDDDDLDHDDDDDPDGDDHPANKDRDDDDDMFAMDDADDAAAEGKAKKGKKKGDRFLKSSEIEGQEFGATTKVGDEDQEDVLSDEDNEERDLDLELEEDDEDQEDDDDDDSLEDDYNGRAERTPSPSAADGAEGGPSNAAADDQEAKRRRAARKAKAKKGMGHKLDSFNMRAELQSGRFDEDGNYVSNSADPHAQHDSWLSGNYSRKKIRATREAQKKREDEADARKKAAGGKGGVGDTGAVTEVECTVAMLDFMDRGESVLETLQRLGKAAQPYSASDHKGKSVSTGSSRRKGGKYAGKGDAKRRALALDSETADPAPAPEAGAGAGAEGDAEPQSKEMDVDPDPPTDHNPPTKPPTKPPPTTQPQPRVQTEAHPTIVALEQYTALSSELMSTFGHINIYDETYEGILRLLKRKGAVPGDWDPAGKKQRDDQGRDQVAQQEQSAASAPGPHDARQFTYRWAPAYLAATQGANAAPDVETYGPFPVADLRGWAASGYFGAPGHCERILLKEGQSSTGAGTGDERWRTWSECGL